jgi:hypothetical protein
MTNPDFICAVLRQGAVRFYGKFAIEIAIRGSNLLIPFRQLPIQLKNKYVLNYL